MASGALRNCPDRARTCTFPGRSPSNCPVLVIDAIVRSLLSQSMPLERYFSELSEYLPLARIEIFSLANNSFRFETMLTLTNLGTATGSVGGSGAFTLRVH